MLMLSFNPLVPTQARLGEIASVVTVIRDINSNARYDECIRLTYQFLILFVHG